MKEMNLSAEYVETICRNLETESVELIDFDSLRKALEEAVKQFADFSEYLSELEMLKGEYRNRILGMLKANVALKEEEEDMEVIARLSDSLSDVSSDELIKLYGKTAVRFRDNFPASFKYLTYANKSSGKNNWAEYKI